MIAAVVSAEDAPLIPWRSGHCLLIAHYGGATHQAWNIGDKQALLRGAPADALILVVWPGEFSSSVLTVKDRELAYLHTLTERQRAKALAEARQ